MNHSEQTLRARTQAEGQSKTMIISISNNVRWGVHREHHLKKTKTHEQHELQLSRKPSRNHETVSDREGFLGLLSGGLQVEACCRAGLIKDSTMKEESRVHSEAPVSQAGQ